MKVNIKSRGVPHATVITEEVDGKQVVLKNCSRVVITAEPNMPVTAVIEVAFFHVDADWIDAKAGILDKNGKFREVSKVIYADGTEEIYA